MAGIEIMLGKSSKGDKPATGSDASDGDDYGEALHEAAAGYQAAMRSGDSKAILKTRRTLRRLERFYDDDHKDS